MSLVKYLKIWFTMRGLTTKKVKIQDFLFNWNIAVVLIAMQNLIQQGGSLSSSGIIGFQSMRKESVTAGNRENYGNSFPGGGFSVTAHLYSRVRGIYRMGTAAGPSTNLHVAAQSYHTTGEQHLLIIWKAGKSV